MKDQYMVEQLKRQRSVPVSYAKGLDIAKTIGADAYFQCSALTAGVQASSPYSTR